MQPNPQLDKLLEKADNYSKFESGTKHTWCSGCGNYGILSALKRAMTLEGYEPKNVQLCYDVGCSGNESDKINAYTIHGLHGRVLPLSAGIQMANSDLKVIAMAGDGATFSEGINHLVHSIRNNYNFTFILHNNSIYGLTIGQASSTTKPGQHIAGTAGITELEPLNTLDFVLSLKPSFVARSFSGMVDHMTDIIQQGLNHKGFSFIEIMQACPTFNKATPQEWYWNKINDVKDISGYNKTDIWAARKIVQNTEQEIPIGVLYQDSTKAVYFDLQANRDNIDTTLVQEVKNYPIESILKEFAL
jgi:2-oxoglutarate/2-oxoacid ferredoxin oxidoreductase subunit beta